MSGFRNYNAALAMAPYFPWPFLGKPAGVVGFGSPEGKLRAQS